MTLRDVYLQHGLQLGVGDDVNGVRQRVAEMQLYAQVALYYQMEAGAVALVGGQVKTKGAAVPVVAVSPFHSSCHILLVEENKLM